MQRTRLTIGLLLLLTLSGCKGAPGTRPQPGEHVTPKLYLPDPWQAGKSALFAVRLQAEGKNGTAAAYLKPDEVPEDTRMYATVRFFRGEELISQLDDLPVTPPPC